MIDPRKTQILEWTRLQRAEQLLFSVGGGDVSFRNIVEQRAEC